MIVVVLAAGIGSRYGGDKQRDALGPNGEWITDLNLLDAAGAGFDAAVLVCRPAHRDEIEKRLRERGPEGVAVRAVSQRPDDLPRRVPGRERPWGTGHALLAARDVIDRPCCVINADDCYGPNTFTAAAQLLARCRPDRGGLVTFELGASLSPSVGVSRGVCRLDGDTLLSIEECTDLTRLEDRVVGRDSNGAGIRVPPTTPASLNTWCLHADTVRSLWADLDTWLATEPGPDDEFQLPTALDARVARGDLAITCAPTPDRWYGMTTRADRDAVVEHLRRRLG